METHNWLAAHFEARRPHLRAVAYRILGSLAEAEDAVQETWLRLSRADTSGVVNLDGWLTTVIARVCLNLLDTRKSQHEESLDASMPAPITSWKGEIDQEQAALLADSVGLALLAVLDTLSPAERLAFVLHDIFDVPFDEIARVVERSPTATRQLASRARRRAQGAAMVQDVDLARQRAVVAAFLAASREGEFRRTAGGPRPRCGPASRPRRRVCGRARRSPRRKRRGREDFRARQGVATGAGERSRGSRGPAWATDSRLQAHNHERQDCRDQCGRRPRAPSPSRDLDPERVRSLSPWRLGEACGGVVSNQVLRGWPWSGVGQAGHKARMCARLRLHPPV